MAPFVFSLSPLLPSAVGRLSASRDDNAVLFFPRCDEGDFFFYVGAKSPFVHYLAFFFNLPICYFLIKITIFFLLSALMNELR